MKNSYGLCFLSSIECRAFILKLNFSDATFLNKENYCRDYDSDDVDCGGKVIVLRSFAHILLVNSTGKVR